LGMKAKGDDIAAVLAGSGNLKFNPDKGKIGVQGAFAGLGAGENGEVTAGGIMTIAYRGQYGTSSYADGASLMAKGDNLAMILTGAADLNINLAKKKVKGQAAIAGAMAEGAESEVSATQFGAYADEKLTFASVEGLSAKGKDGILAGAVAGYLPGTLLNGVYVDLKKGEIYDSKFRAEAFGSNPIFAYGYVNYNNAEGKEVEFSRNPDAYSEVPVTPASTWGEMSSSRI
jgi:hypothetical protein